MANEPTVRHIVAVVRLNSPQGCTAASVALRLGTKQVQATRKALDLQVQAGVLSSDEIWNGEQYVCCLYRVREGK